MMLEDINFFNDNRYLKTMKETSHDTANCEYMTESQLIVIDFDAVKDAYLKEKESSSDLKSNDALYIKNKDKCYFIEFKNGRLNGDTITSLFRKIYDSLLVFLDISNTTIEYTRNHLNYILVYNIDKNPNNSKINKLYNPAFHALVSGWEKASNEIYEKFGLAKRFKGLFLKEVLTLNEKQFDEWINSESNE